MTEPEDDGDPDDVGAILTRGEVERLFSQWREVELQTRRLFANVAGGGTDG
jgi:hypothetical protein